MGAGCRHEQRACNDCPARSPCHTPAPFLTCRAPADRIANGKRRKFIKIRHSTDENLLDVPGLDLRNRARVRVDGPTSPRVASGWTGDPEAETRGHGSMAA